MHYLIPFILMAVASTHLIRYGQARHCRMAWVGALTYATGGVFALLWTWHTGKAISQTALVYGGATGVALGTTYLVFNATIRIFGVGIAHTVRQMALAVPILVCLLLWDETLAAVPAVGVALVFVAMSMMSKPLALHEHARPVWAWCLPALLLICAGLTTTLFKAYARQGAVGGQAPFLVCMCAGAVVAVGGRAFHSGERLGGRDVLFGLILGLDNVLMNFFRVRALETDAGVRVFPAMSVGVILVSATVAMVVWKERYKGRVLVGMILALVALILIILPRMLG